MSFSAQPVVIDGKGHLLGRLASIVSKQVSREPLSKIVTARWIGLGGYRCRKGGDGMGGSVEERCPKVENVFGGGDTCWRLGRLDGGFSCNVECRIGTKLT
jgi:hypothetical protein